MHRSLGQSRRTLRLALVRKENPTPGIHDTLTEGDNVIQHLDSNIVAGGDQGGLLQDLTDNGQVLIKVLSNCLGNVPKSFEDSWLELVGGALEIMLEIVH